MVREGRAMPPGPAKWQHTAAPQCSPQMCRRNATLGCVVSLLGRSQMPVCEVYHVVQPPAQLSCLPNNCIVFSRHEDGAHPFCCCTAIPLPFCALVR
eukprot:6468250-Amphidinium_carterae.2